MKKILLVFSLSLMVLFQACNKHDVKKVPTHTVVDMSGRSVTLPLKINSIVSLGATPVINSFIMAFGEQGKIINSLPSFVKMPAFKFEYIFAPNLKNNENMQYADKSPMIEKLIKAKPDVIFVLAFQKKIADLLAKKGLNVVVLDWKNYNDVKPLMNLLASIFSKKKVASEYLLYFDAVIKKANNISKNLTKDQKVSVLYTTLKNLSQPHLIAEWWIRTAGGRSVTDNGRSQDRYAYSLEQLLKWNPDVIIVSTLADKKELFKDSRFKNLKALKDKRVYIAPIGAHKWAHCTIEQPLTVLWALNKFYPALYTEGELRKDVEAFYEKFFKVKLSKTQLSELLSGVNK